MIILYFTSTGNSLAVAKKFDAELISIPQEIHDLPKEYKDDVIGMIFPCYNFTAPRIVQDFVKKVKLEAEYLFAVITYGNMSAGATTAFAELAAAAGHHFHYVNQLMMMDNALDYFDMDQQREVLESKQVELHLKQIQEDVTARRELHPDATEEERAMTRMNGAGQDHLSGKYAELFSVNEQCVKCGICAKVCPAGNIAVKDSVVFSEHCMECLACIHNCPQNAIHLKTEKSGARWVHPDVTVEELIRANCQQFR